MHKDLPQRRLTPNPECVMLCPVLEADRAASELGVGLAVEDFQRHCAQSRDCTGTIIDQTRLVFKCPLFGVEASI